MINFYKYHGAGNDFIVIDDRDLSFDTNDKNKINLLCHRRFGIGADGILLLRNHIDSDFEMVYINPDGSIGAMCGNGSRCVVHFANFILKIIKNPKQVKFLAPDGMHEAEVLDSGSIKVKMQDVKGVGERNNLPFVCQGTTPHNIMWVENLKDYPVFAEGRKTRYGDPNGVNVNFVEIVDGVFNVRTYERGVEDETFACGTGATSVALVAHSSGKLKENICRIKMPGGELVIEFENRKDGSYQNIWMSGPARMVFKGEIE